MHSCHRIIRRQRPALAHDTIALMNPHQFDRASVVVVGLTLAGVLALVIYAIYLTIFGSVT